MQRRNLTLWLIALLAFTLRATAADPCDCPAAIRTQLPQFDALLTMTAAQQKQVEKTHFLWGKPTTPANAGHEHLLHQPDFLTWYDDDLRVPLWVSYRLTKADLAPTLHRTQCFRRDPRLADDAAATCDDYNEPTYDRGHLAPNADFERSLAAMVNTYLFSNMTPQHSNFNRGIWSRLEDHARAWAKLKGEVYIITGAVFDADDDHRRDSDATARRVPGRNRVAIPTHFYKIIIHPAFTGDEALAFLLRHDNAEHTGDAGDEYLRQNLTSIQNIETLTGAKFIPKLNKARRDPLEKQQADKLWPLR